MVAKEFYLGQISLEEEEEEEEEAGDEESTLLQASRDESDAEAEEAMSLCDLPLYSNSSISAQWGGGNNNFSKEYEKNSSQSNKEEDDDDDFFEFFSEDFTTSNSTTTYHHRTISDNIIFCGKLIPFKDPPKNTDQSSSNMIQKGNNTFVPWRSNSTSRSRSNSKAMMMTCNKGGISHGSAKGNNNLTSSSSSSSFEYSSIGKVSLLRSPTKSRWFLFMFGMTRLSTNTGNMELRDIRNRQSRNSRRTKFVAAATPENREEVVEKMMMKEGEGKGNCKRLWKVLKSISMGLGCSSSKLANDVVKATFV